MSELLKKAKNLFDICKDKTGVGECLLTVSLLRHREDLVLEAFNNFAVTQPVSNSAGMLECTEVLFIISFVKDNSNDSYQRK